MTRDHFASSLAMNWRYSLGKFGNDIGAGRRKSLSGFLTGDAFDDAGVQAGNDRWRSAGRAQMPDQVGTS
jgi:hypothetical protein